MRNHRALRSTVVALAAFSIAAPLAAASAMTAREEPELEWRLTPTGSAAQLRGLDAVNHRVAWASGSEGTVLRTLNSGREWDSVGPPGTAALEFRDIEAFGRRRALILSIGTGDASRIYRTDHGGACRRRFPASLPSRRAAHVSSPDPAATPGSQPAAHRKRVFSTPATGARPGPWQRRRFEAQRPAASSPSPFATPSGASPSGVTSPSPTKRSMPWH